MSHCKTPKCLLNADCLFRITHTHTHTQQLWATYGLFMLNSYGVCLQMSARCIRIVYRRLSSRQSWETSVCLSSRRTDGGTKSRRQQPTPIRLGSENPSWPVWCGLWLRTALSPPTANQSSWNRSDGDTDGGRRSSWTCRRRAFCSTSNRSLALLRRDLSRPLNEQSQHA